MFNLLEVTDYATRITAQNDCLNIIALGQTESFPLKTLDALVVANPAISITGYALEQLAQQKIAVVICQRSFCPAGVLLPLGNTSAEEMHSFTLQTQASMPIKKQLWQEIIKSKIANQEQILIQYRRSSKLRQMTNLVRSGDPDNVEARAAAVYWKTLNLFPRRDTMADDANRLLNYAYTVIYSATARYICASVLHPHIGIKHHNQYNPFCLASDLMEPYRPFADEIVLQMMPDMDSLSRENREFILHQLYSKKVLIGKAYVPLFQAIRQTVCSFKRALAEKQPKCLLLPKFSDREVA